MVGQRLFIAGLMLLGLPAGSLLAAQDEGEQSPPRVDVEYVVFAVSEDAIIGDETYPQDPGLPPLEEALKARSAAAADAGLRSTAPDRLTGVASTLAESDDYRVLIHEAWNVPASSGSEAPYLRLFLDEREPGSETGTTDSTNRFQDEHLIDNAPGADGEQQDEPAVDVARPLDGTLKVYLNRYYHVAVDLLFNPQVTREETDPEQQARERARRIEALLSGQIDIEEFGEQEAAESDPFLGYRLTDSRRVDTGRPHYLDHPRYGVIIRIDEIESESAN